MMCIRTMFAKTSDGLVFRGGPTRRNKLWTSIPQGAHNGLEQLPEVLFIVIFVNGIRLKVVQLGFGMFKLCLSLFESFFSSLSFFFSSDDLSEHFPALIVKSSERWLSYVFSQDDLLLWMMLQFIRNFFMLFVENTNETLAHLMVCFFRFIQLQIHFDFLLKCCGKFHLRIIYGFRSFQTHNCNELLNIDNLIAVGISLPNHFVNLLLSELFTQILKHRSEFAGIETAALIFVEKFEGFPEVIVGKGYPETNSHNVFEHIVRDFNRLFQELGYL
jgi:hypothetical protein